MSLNEKIHRVTESLRSNGWHEYAAEEKARNIVSLLILEETGSVAERMRLIQASLPKPTNHNGVGRMSNGVARSVLDAYESV
jgi:hypothetical protein